MYLLKEEALVHDTLNPKLWDIKTMQLLPEVKEKIDLIVENFIDFISKYKSDNFKFRPLDINLVGSNASYNYNEHSDLDVSIVVNFDMLGTSDEIADDYFHAKKNEFNNTYNPKIRGVDIELYIADQKTVNISNGVYSVIHNRWIKKPVKLKAPKNVNVKDSVDEIVKAIDKTVEEGNREALERLMDSIYLMRRNSLIVNGEFGRGNLIYKELRNLGAIDKIHDAIDGCKHNEMSINESKVELYIQDKQNKNKIKSQIEKQNKKFENSDYKIVKSLKTVLDKNPKGFKSIQPILKKLIDEKCYTKNNTSMRIYKFNGIDLLLIHTSKNKNEVEKELMSGRYTTCTAYWYSEKYNRIQEFVVF